MRTQRFSIALAAAMLLLAPQIGAAQEHPAGLERLGVYDAIRIAQQGSPMLNELRQQLQSKHGERWGAYGLQPPELVYMREGIRGAGGTYAEQRWGISQAIDFPLQSYYRVRRIDTEQEAILQQIEAEELNTRSAIKKAYTDLLYAQEIVHLRRDEVRLSRELEEAVRTRLDVGESSGLDLIKAEIQMTEAETNLEEAERAFQNARYALFHAAGLDPENQRYEVQFPDTLAYFPVSIDQEEVLHELENQAVLRSASRRLEAAQWGTRWARSTLLPDLQIDFYPQDYGNGFRNYGFQVGVRLPLWFMLNNRSTMQAARAQVQVESWRRQGVYLGLKKEIEQAWHSYETSERTIRRYHDLVLGRAAELLHLTREGYRIGEVDLLSLLDTQRTYLAGQKRYYDALHDYYYHLIDLERFLRRDLVFGQPPAPQLTSAPASPAPSP